MLVHQDAVNRAKCPKRSYPQGHDAMDCDDAVVWQLADVAAIPLASSRALCLAIPVTFMVRARKITVADDAVAD